MTLYAFQEEKSIKGKEIFRKILSKLKNRLWLLLFLIVPIVPSMLIISRDLWTIDRLDIDGWMELIGLMHEVYTGDIQFGDITNPQISTPGFPFIGGLLDIFINDPFTTRLVLNTLCFIGTGLVTYKMVDLFGIGKGGFVFAIVSPVFYVCSLGSVPPIASYCFQQCSIYTR
ncbi:MAG: hypothetical protein ACTSUE_13670 [Promethearchaeota archaeon]